MLSDLLNLFFPKYCAYCKNILQNTARVLCKNCLTCLPLRNDPYDENLTRSLALLFDLEKAYSLLYLRDQPMTSKLIHELKYYNNPKLGIVLGKFLGDRLASDFDVLLPVPLHFKKQKKRGYNQSQKIAMGIAQSINTEIDTQNLIRIKNNVSQVRLKTYQERFENTMDIFRLNNSSVFEDKHLLFIDDVITTSSTIYDCVRLFLPIKNVKISIACISFAG